MNKAFFVHDRLKNEDRNNNSVTKPCPVESASELEKSSIPENIPW